MDRAERLVGREAEMGRLLEALRDPPCLILVSGEAGIGKTRLVSAAADQARKGAQVLWGVSHPVVEPLPLGAVVSALRPLATVPDPRRLSPVAGALRTLLPELADALPVPVANSDEASGRYRQFRAVRELLDALGTAVLVLEDLQWCDSETTDFLRFLSAEMPPLLAIMMTCRPGPSGVDTRLGARLAHVRSPVTAARIDLGPLDADDVRELARIELDGAPVSTVMAGELHQRTRGNPGAVREVARLLCDRRLSLGRSVEAMYTLRELEDLDLPWTLRDTVLTRVSELPAGARRLVEASAVIGAPATPRDLGRVAGLAPARAAAAVRVALASSLLVEARDGQCRSRDALAEEAVQASIPAHERRLLHRRAAAALEGVKPRPLTRLARHYRGAGAVRLWAQTAEQAADEAADGLDHTSAIRLVADIIELPHLSSDARARLALKLGGWAQHAHGRRSEAVRALRHVLESGGLPSAMRGELRHVLGDLLSIGGDAAGARTAWLTAAAELRGHADQRAHNLMTLGLPIFPVGDRPQHLEMVDKAMSLTSPGSTGPERRIPLLAMRAMALAYMGDPRATAAVDDIPWDDTAPAAEYHLMWAAMNLIDPYYARGRYARARNLAREAEQRAAELDHRGALAVAAHHFVALDWATGSWHGLRERVEALADTSEVPREWAARTGCIAGLLALAQGEAEAAERFLNLANETAHTAAVLPVMASTSGGLACLQLRTGHPDAAIDQVSGVLRYIRSKGIWVWGAELVRPLVEALLARDRRDEAADVVDEMHAGLNGQDSPLALAALAWARALVYRSRGASGDALRYLNQARALHGALPRPYEAAEVARIEGEWALSIEDPRGAELLFGALGAFTTLGASADADRARRALRRFGLRAPRGVGSGRIGFGDALTPRQQEVARLAADGLTNREIGDRLALSTKTVAHHLGHAMRKTGTRSRVVLARGWSDTMDVRRSRT